MSILGSGYGFICIMLAYRELRLNLMLLTQVNVNHDTSVQIMSPEETFQLGYSITLMRSLRCWPLETRILQD